MADEVATRVALMRYGSYRLRKCILCNRRISKRLSVTQCYMLTKGIHQCCTWSALSPRQYKRFHIGIMSLCNRDISGSCHGSVDATIYNDTMVQ